MGSGKARTGSEKEGEIIELEEAVQVVCRIHEELESGFNLVDALEAAKEKVRCQAAQKKGVTNGSGKI